MKQLNEMIEHREEQYDNEGGGWSRWVKIFGVGAGIAGQDSTALRASRDRDSCY